MFPTLLTDIFNWLQLLFFYAAFLYVIIMSAAFAERVVHGKKFDAPNSLLLLLYGAVVYLLTVVTWYFR